jgi:hypothetical protein
MKFWAKHRKLFYVPGMISLLLIPVICLWFINSNGYFKKDYSVDFTISDSITESPVNLKTDHKYPQLAYVPKRNYISFLFDGNNDEQKLKDLVAPLKRMIDKNDTLVGLKFTFGKHAKYDTYIAAQDLLFINKANYYVIHKNNIYILEHPIKKSNGRRIAIIPYGCGYASYNQEYWAELGRIEARKLFIKNAKQFWQIPLALLGIILLNLYMLIKFNKNRIYNQKSYI